MRTPGAESQAEQVPPSVSPRAILANWIQGSGLTRAEIAERAGLTERAIRQFVSGERELGIPSLAALAGALGQDPEPLLRACGGAVDRRKLFQFVGAVTVLGARMGLTQQGQPSLQESADLVLRLPLDVLAEIGIGLERRGHRQEAGPILNYLADPRGGGALLRATRRSGQRTAQLAAAAAIAHLGHLELDRGAWQTALRSFERALELLWQEDLGQVREAELWERWQRATTLSRKHFELWCLQMIGVSNQLAGRKQELDRAAEALDLVAEDAMERPERIELVSGNALRDLAAVIVSVNSATPLAGRQLDESVAVLADTPEQDMLGMSLLQRARWRKGQGHRAGMEADAIAGLALLPRAGILRCNALNSVAELYAEFEPQLARQLAAESHRDASAEGYEGQKRRAEAILQRLSG
jgi:transcriptional regulator with XRE-family HTH domain